MYGLFDGVVLALLGSRKVWEAEARVIGGLVDDEAMDFKRSVQDQCNMIAIAGEPSPLFKPGTFSYDQ